jgi:hypothetical protein
MDGTVREKMGVSQDGDGIDLIMFLLLRIIDGSNLSARSSFCSY